MTTSRRAGQMAHVTMWIMTNIRGLDPFPRGLTHELPAELRGAVARMGRSGAAVRLYRKRGWNDSAVKAAFNRDRSEVQRLLDELQHREQNPTLFD